MKVHDLAKKYNTDNNTIQRTARAAGLNPGTSSADITASDQAKLAAYIEDQGLITAERKNAERSANQAAAAAAKRKPEPVETVDAVPAKRAGSGFKILIHEEYLDWLTANPSSAPASVRKRAHLVHEQMLARGQPVAQAKRTKGANNGWYRSPLGGSNRNQYYLYWARPGHSVAAQYGLEGQTVLLRAVRHHDRTDEPLAADGALHPLLRSDAVARADSPDQPYTELQRQVEADDARLLVVRGHPGSGKTTTLYLKARRRTGGRIVYLTYSERLAADARAEFAAHVDPAVEAVVLTIRELFAVGDAAPVDDPEQAELADRLENALTSDRRHRGQWSGQTHLLFAELYAHLFGDTACQLPDCTSADSRNARDAYVRSRGAAIGEVAADLAWKLAAAIPAGEVGNIFVGPMRARALLASDGQVAKAAQSLGAADLVLVDEVQDLTRAELAALCAILARNQLNAAPKGQIVFAGDQGQTVRPTDFDWGVLSDALKTAVGAQAVGKELDTNVRSPKAIARLVNHSWSLYKTIAKTTRPAGRATAESGEDGIGQVLHCRFEGAPHEVASFADDLARTLNVQWITPSDWSLDGVRAQPIAGALTSTMAKGLGFSRVALHNCGQHLLDIAKIEAAGDTKLAELARRTLIDQFRVAISRATDKLIFFESGSKGANACLLEFLTGNEDPWASAVVANLAPAELKAQLSADYSDHLERADEYLNAAESFLSDRPEKALENIGWALGQLDVAADDEQHTKASRRANAHLLAAHAEVHIALRPSVTRDARMAGLRSAGERASAAKHEEFRRLCLALAGVEGAKAFDGAESIKQAALALKALEGKGMRPGSLRKAEAYLLSAGKALVKSKTAKANRDFGKVWEALGELSEVARFHNQHAELQTWKDEHIDHAAATLLGGHSPSGIVLDDAEKWLKRRSSPNAMLAAKLARCRGQFLEASGLYEQAGACGDALICAREAGELELGIRLAEQANDADAADILRWLKTVQAALCRPAGAPKLAITAAEREAMERQFRAALSA